MASYQSEQARALLAFMRVHFDKPYTVEELVADMRSEGVQNPPGSSTAYRLMTRFVEQGTVKRFVQGHSRRFLYQIAGGESCHRHLHLKCVECGRLIHMDDEVSEDILERVEGKSGFFVDRDETTLVGRCGKCRG